jgi:hypothetical protein
MMGGPIARRVGLDRNPLRRRSDRIEAWLTLILVSMILVVAPFIAWRAAATAYEQSVRASEWNRQHRFEVTATLVADAVVVVDSVVDAGQTAETTATARWPAPDGSVRSGAVPVQPGQRAGSTVAIWTDDRGDMAGAPLRSHPAMTALTAGLFTAFGVVAAGLAVLLLVRRRLDTGRLEHWQTEWIYVEPDWSGRHLAD